ncbi:class I SAM-dependent methyltransferase [uncultured Pseudoteredinibacter sp.]|uniref:class I SAM-dependent methyltransferase n=1 Tax=uncultured Pseudoteredinibacter sp. TaxID=1641701 RepID=UPI00262E8553|nr:class I SAM-dependent methyltransferase [uncultured Pseudoteredinibacter sp.]
MSTHLSWSQYWRGGAGESLQAHPASPLYGFASEYFLKRISTQESVLDIATGNGALLRRLPLEHGGLRAGVDYSDISPQLELRNKHSFVRMDGSRLGFAASSFDWVVSQFGFEYVSREPALAELFRVLRERAQVMLLCHREGSYLCAHSKQQLLEAQLLMKSPLFLLARQWSECFHCEQFERCELKLCMDSLFAQIRLPKESSLLLALLHGVMQWVRDVQSGRYTGQQAQQIVNQWVIALEANIERLAHQLDVALGTKDQKYLINEFKRQGFKAKTVAISEQGRSLAWGMYFSRGG